MRILSTLLTVCVMVGLVSPLHADQDKADAKKSLTVAHLKLTGSMPEKPPTVDPLLGQLGETFQTKLDRLKKARTDKEVQAVLLEIDGLTIGWGKLNELSQAIAAIRAAGKKVFAHIESGASKDYLLALACDDICIPEAGWLMLTGIRAEATFYKDLFDKIGVKADFLQMGDFKAAAEPYTRNSLSQANREQMTAMLDDFYENEIVARICKARKLDANRVRELIDAGPYTARAAVKAGLIDRTGYFSGYEATLEKLLGVPSVKIEKDYGKKKDEELDIFGLYRKLLFGPIRSTTSRAPKVAVIYATGAIVTGKSSNGLLMGESVGSETLVKAIREAEEDKTVKAIVLRVDSPGGSALASDLIWHELKRCKKPVVASMGDVAASGGYYISMGASKVFAEPGTITGSIGVIGGKLATRPMFDKIGIKTEVIARGQNSGLLTSGDVFSPSEKKVFQTLMEDIYDQFLNKTLENRQAAGQKLTFDDLKKLAGGRVWTGRQAKARGLVDELGTLPDAIAAAAKMGGLPADKEPELLQLPKSKNSLDSLLDQVFGLKATGLESQVVGKLPVEVLDKLRGVDVLLELRREPVWALLPFRLEVR